MKEKEKGTIVKGILSGLAIVLTFVIGSIAYTWPAPLAIWEQRTDRFMSDGTDPTTAPFHYDLLHRAYLENPGLMFYGAFPNPRINAPEGTVAWYSPLEKISGLILPFLVPLEQVSPLIAMILMVLNGLCFYGMARSLNWEKLLSLSLAFAWAFSAFTRARAQVHPSLVGIYSVPLAVWGLSILQRNPRNALFAALIFLGCATSPHYYIIFLFALSPFFIAFYLASPQVRSSWPKSVLPLAVAVLPAALFLAVSFLKPVPSDFEKHVANVLPLTGKSQTWPHPFLTIFSAHPRDFFSGDIAIGEFDWNPLRAEINSAIRQDPDTANFHEHAVGIRWILWLAVLLSLSLILKHRKTLPFRSFEGGSLLAFLALGVFSFLASLPPDWGWIWGPSAWIHRLVEQIRVPSRFGIFTHFSILMVIGLTAHWWMNHQSLSRAMKRTLSLTLGLLILLDFPPGLNPMPMAMTAPSLEPLISQKSGPCGMGMHFPHISGSQNSIAYYTLLQSLRGTDCSVLNPDAANSRDFMMGHLFGYQNKEMIQKVISNDPEFRDKLVRFAQCNKLDWIVFDSRLPAEFTQEVCRSIQGRSMGQGLCRSQLPVTEVPYGMPDVCLVQIR